MEAGGGAGVRVPCRVHILGAAGSGTTTLGQLLAEKLGVHHHDTDHFFWEVTDPPFQKSRSHDERRRLLQLVLDEESSWILSGSLCGWGDVFIPLFTHVVFCRVPTQERLERIRRRETQRFGARIEAGGDMFKMHEDFLTWAAGYDTGGPEMRSLALHEAWLQRLRCPVLRLETPEDSAALAERVLRWG